MKNFLRQAGGIGAGFSQFVLVRHHKRDQLLVSADYQ